MKIELVEVVVLPTVGVLQVTGLQAIVIWLILPLGAAIVGLWSITVPGEVVKAIVNKVFSLKAINVILISRNPLPCH